MTRYFKIPQGTNGESKKESCGELGRFMPEERVNVMKVWVVGLLELGRGLELGKTVLSAQILP
ncbi:hypothetical protein WG66_010920 [Moniliophthora roreri]|nr:hypothetical protein WG66_010920 [Moniliophthora roreri]